MTSGISAVFCQGRAAGCTSTLDSRTDLPVCLSVCLSACPSVWGDLFCQRSKSNVGRIGASPCQSESQSTPAGVGFPKVTDPCPTPITHWPFTYSACSPSRARVRSQLFLNFALQRGCCSLPHASSTQTAWDFGFYCRIWSLFFIRYCTGRYFFFD